MAADELQIAMQVVRDQRAVIDQLEAEASALKERLVALESAIVEKFGAHGVLIIQYSDPMKSDSERRKAATAAIAYEKAKPGTSSEQTVFHLFGALEERRLARRQAKAQLIDVTPLTPSPDPAA